MTGGQIDVQWCLGGFAHTAESAIETFFRIYFDDIFERFGILITTSAVAYLVK